MLGSSNPCLDIPNEINKMNTDCNLLLNIIKQYKIVKNTNILDIGCGNGFYVFGLADYINSICGLDPSNSMLESAKKNQKYFKKENIKFLKGSIENNSLKEKFDIVIFSYSLHFTNDSYKSLLLARDYLTSDGLLIIIEPTKEYVSNKLTIGHKDYDKEYYDLKQQFLKKSKNDIYLFAKNHELIYYNYNDKHFISIIKVLTNN